MHSSTHTDVKRKILYKKNKLKSIVIFLLTQAASLATPEALNLKLVEGKLPMGIVAVQMLTFSVISVFFSASTHFRGKATIDAMSVDEILEQPV